MNRELAKRGETSKILKSANSGLKFLISWVTLDKGLNLAKPQSSCKMRTVRACVFSWGVVWMREGIPRKVSSTIWGT